MGSEMTIHDRGRVERGKFPKKKRASKRAHRKWEAKKGWERKKKETQLLCGKIKKLRKRGGLSGYFSFENSPGLWTLLRNLGRNIRCQELVDLLTTYESSPPSRVPLQNSSLREKKERKTPHRQSMKEIERVPNEAKRGGR